jgi:phosphoglycerate dehydrogenase-like enzyme
MSGVRIVILGGSHKFNDVFPKDVISAFEALGEVTIDKRGAAIGEHELVDLLADADALVTTWGAPRITSGVLNKAKRLKFIGHAAGSIRHIIPREAIEKGIVVTNAAKVMGRGVGEMNLAYMLAAMRNLTGFYENKKRGYWCERYETYNVRGLFYQTVGIVGLGNTAREMIKLLRPFECTVLVYDPYVSAESMEALGCKKATLDEVLCEATVVTLHAPVLPETRHMIGKRELALIRDEAVFINTARGWLVDHVALVDEAKKGRFQVWLDVTDPEPLPPDHPLWKLENVMITPHIAGPTPDRRRDMGMDIAQKLREFLKTGEVMDGIDLRRYDTMA